MVSELARAKESITSPRPSKGPLRRRRGTTVLWAPETSNGTQGALTRLLGQGLQLTSACRRAMSATTKVVKI